MLSTTNLRHVLGHLWELMGGNRGRDALGLIIGAGKPELDLPLCAVKAIRAMDGILGPINTKLGPNAIGTLSFS